jgi:hypothetical protein
MKNKVGILTTHFAINYGAVLQAYALYRFLKLNRFDVELINYRSNDAVYGRKLYAFKPNLKSIIKGILLVSSLKFRSDFRKKVDAFDSFIETKTSLSDKIYFNFSNLNDEIKNYGILICGSDQIWNLNLLHEQPYYLNFPGKTITHKFIAYAPSVAEDLSDTQWNELCRDIEKIDFLSTREKFSSKKLQSLQKQTVHTVADPTLILPITEWDDIIEEVDISEEYILCYGVASDYKFKSLVKQTRAINDMKIVTINMKKFSISNSKNYNNLSPGQFVWLFKNATQTICSSYHGTLFSIIFNKEFYATGHSSRQSRMLNILETLDLTERFIDEKNIENFTNLTKKIDYSKVNKKLLEYVEYSKNYLIESINSK